MGEHKLIHSFIHSFILLHLFLVCHAVGRCTLIVEVDARPPQAGVHVCDYDARVEWVVFDVDVGRLVRRFVRSLRRLLQFRRRWTDKRGWVKRLGGKEPEVGSDRQRQRADSEKAEHQRQVPETSFTTMHRENTFDHLYYRLPPADPLYTVCTYNVRAI